MDLVTAGAVVAICAGIYIIFDFRSGRDHWSWYYPLICIIETLDAAWGLAKHEWDTFAVGTAFAIFWGWMWWRHRKRKRKDPAAKSYGYKARALIANLVARQREAEVPTR